MNFEEVQSINGVVGSLFLCAYTFCMIMILSNLFLALLILSHQEAVHKLSQGLPDSDIGTFMSEYFKSKLENLGEQLSDLFSKSGKGKNAKKRADSNISYSEVLISDPANQCQIAHEESAVTLADVTLKLASFDSMEDLSGSEDFQTAKDAESDIASFYSIKDVPLAEEIIVTKENVDDMLSDIQEESEEATVFHDIRKCLMGVVHELREMRSSIKEISRKRKKAKLRKTGGDGRLQSCACPNENEEEQLNSSDQSTVFSTFCSYLDYMWQSLGPCSNSRANSEETLAENSEKCAILPT